jgi:DNA-binding NtrC family response regulator
MSIDCPKPMENVEVLLIGADKASTMRRAINAGRSERFHFTQTPTLSQGLHVLQESRFDVVLLDLSLPDASAAESVKKTLERAGDVPLIALVNEREITNAAEALRLGTDDYFVKGCCRDCLIRTILDAIDRKRLVADKGKTPAQLTAHLSHELRNALACIHQFGTIMIDGLAGSVSEEQREYLCIMLENASKIRSVLDAALEGTSVPESYP